jgi:hypothetical protein
MDDLVFNLRDRVYHRRAALHGIVVDRGTDADGPYYKLQYEAPYDQTRPPARVPASEVSTPPAPKIYG